MEEEKKVLDATDPVKEGRLSLPWIILICVGVILLVLGGYLYRQKNLTVGGLSLNLQTGALDKAAAEKFILDYINNDILAGQATATLSDFALKSGVYTFKVNIQGQSVDSAMTLDGTVLYPNVLPIENKNTNANTNANTGSSTITPAEKSTAYLFTMSFCPYGNDAETAMKPVADLLKDKATIEPHYVIYSNYKNNSPDYCLDAAGKYCSMHGVQELNQDIRELCVYKYNAAKYWEFTANINATCSSTNADTCWTAVAEGLGIDTEKISTCQKDEGTALLDAEIALAAKYNVQGSPALVINETTYSGERTAEAYKTAVCSGFNTKPEVCSQTLSSTNNTNSGSCTTN